MQKYEMSWPNELLSVDRLSFPTNQLIHWLSRIQHQKQISKTLREKEELAQPSIRRFLVPLPVSEGVIHSKFPP